MPIIARSVLMGSAIGAMTYSTASPGVAFVSTRTDHQFERLSHFYILTDPFLPLPTTGCEAHYCICIVRSKTRQRMHHLQVHGTPLPPGGSVPGVGILTIVDAVRMRY